MTLLRTPTLLPVGLGVVIVVGLALLFAGGALAGPREGEIRLAQFDDPSLPSYASPTTRRRVIQRREPAAAPFALPTSPISAPRPAPAPDSGKPEIPGENEFPPYQQELLRLAEILGAVQFLRDLCGAGEGMQWRDRMQDVIAAEEPNPAWRMRLMDSYNRGYQAYERTYRDCTPAAARAAEIFVAEGKDLSGTIKARYAN